MSRQAVPILYELTARDNTSSTLHHSAARDFDPTVTDGHAPAPPPPGDALAIVFDIITERLAAYTVTVRVIGEIDLLTAPELERYLRLALGGATSTVILDLSACWYLNSTGLKAIVHANDLCNGRSTLALVVPPDGIPHRTVEIARLDQILPVYPTLEAALAQSANRTYVRSDEPTGRASF